MTYTENYNLKKPDLDDPAKIGDINDNMDTLDEVIANLNPLPDVTSSDNGAFLRVVDGEWAKSTIASASGGSY